MLGFQPPSDSRLQPARSRVGMARRPGTVSALLMALALLAGVPSPAHAQDGKGRAASLTREIDLRPKFQVGRDIRFKMELSDREIAPKATGSTPKKKDPPKSSPPGQPQAKENAFRQEITVRLKPEATDAEGNTTLALTLEGFKMSGDGPMGKIEFDSSKPADAADPMDALFRSITTTTMTVVIDRNGEVKGITPRGDGGGAGSLIAGNVTGGSFMRSLVGPIFSPRPGRTTARVGESWSEESQMKSGAGDWTLVVTKTLARASANTATITMKGAAKIDPASIGGGMGAGANPKSETVYTGEATWNTEAGMLDKLETKMMSDVGLVGGLGDLAGLGGLSGGMGGGLGGIDGEAQDGVQSKPSRHETVVRVQRLR